MVQEILVTGQTSKKRADKEMAEVLIHPKSATGVARRAPELSNFRLEFVLELSEAMS